MHINRALLSVRSQIRGILERYHHSPTIPNIFDSEIEDCLLQIRNEFQKACTKTGQSIIWPKMILDYKPNENDEVIPVSTPIRDDRGFILGLRVVKKDHLTKSQSPKVYLEWFSPEPE